MEVSNGKLVFPNEKTSWVRCDVDDSIHLIAVFAQDEKTLQTVIEKTLEYARNFDKVKVSCPKIKRWIEKHGFEKKVCYTKLLNFRENLEKFNKYHSPEATATFLDYKDGLVFVKFSGPFCFSCGVYDYFEDPIQDLDVEVLEYEESDEGFIVKYKIEI